MCYKHVLLDVTGFSHKRSGSDRTIRRDLRRSSASLRDENGWDNTKTAKLLE